jgi:diguanylate cyclase (GGDEF)-like protein/PAS domain S-box-containing protein
MVVHLFRKPSSRDTALGAYLTRVQSLRDRCAAESAFTNAMRLRRADALMQAVFESTSDGIIIVDEWGRVEVANAAAAALLDSSMDGLNGRLLIELIPDSALAIGEGLRMSRLPCPYQESIISRPDGSKVYLEFGVSRMQFGDELVGIAIVRDITDRRVQQRELEHRALHDALTGLPNRVLLIDRMESALALGERLRKPLALLMLDLDRFKEVNDTLGHSAGDALLSEVANRLSAAQRSMDTIARLGGDEFAVLLPSISQLQDAIDVALRMVQVIRAPFQFNGLVIEVGVSIGIALAPDHARERDKLLQCADVAMYAAKQEQKDFAVYNQDKDHNSIRHLTITGQLRRAIENKEIFLLYQPQIDFPSLQSKSAEALARWDHPVHGPVSPIEFILHAERTGLIHDLTVLILDTAIGQVAKWQQQGLEIRVAINISAKALHDTAFPQLVADTLSHANVGANLVTLEITESAIMCDPAKALRVARTITEMGLYLSVDDFGTGYSSLSYLSNLPANELKIDRSFVSRMTQKSKDAAIVQSTIDLAHNLGLKVVAEGVENLEIFKQLVFLGCDVGQGYYVCKPTRADDLAAWFKQPISNELIALVARRQIAG